MQLHVPSDDLKGVASQLRSGSRQGPVEQSALRGQPDGLIDMPLPPHGVDVRSLQCMTTRFRQYHAAASAEMAEVNEPDR